MTIDLAKEAEIRRLYDAEHWKRGTIAAQLGVHADVVDRVLDVGTDHRQWLKWISKTPVREGVTTFGDLPIKEVTADDVEAVRDVLNKAIEEWETAGKVRGTGMAYATAANVWSILTCAMKHASTRKGARELRVREEQGNPCKDVPPPTVGHAKRCH